MGGCVRVGFERVVVSRWEFEEGAELAGRITSLGRRSEGSEIEGSESLSLTSSMRGLDMVDCGYM